MSEIVGAMFIVVAAVAVYAHAQTLSSQSTVTNGPSPSCPTGYELVMQAGIMARSSIKCAPTNNLIEPTWK
jgi:hypothetical protein